MMRNPEEQPRESQVVKSCGVLGKGIVWADVSEDDDDDCFYEDGERKVPSLDAPYTQSEDDSESESEEEIFASSSESDDSEFREGQYNTGDATAAVAEKEEQGRQLSKKEQKKLELEELNAAFAELGITVDIPTSPPSTPPLSAPADNCTKEAPSKSAKKKRKNKKTAESRKGETASAECSAAADVVDETTKASKTAPENDAESGGTVNREEAVNLLKKIRPPKQRKVGGAVAAQATVLAEAKKRAEGKKPKLKKSERIPQYQK